MNGISEILLTIMVLMVGNTGTMAEEINVIRSLFEMVRSPQRGGPGQRVPWRERWNAEYGMSEGEIADESKRLAAENIKKRKSNFGSQLGCTNANPQPPSETYEREMQELRLRMNHAEEKIDNQMSMITSHQTEVSTNFNALAKYNNELTCTLMSEENHSDKTKTALNVGLTHCAKFANTLAEQDTMRIEETRKYVEMLERQREQNEAFRVSFTEPPKSPTAEPDQDVVSMSGTSVI